MTNTTAKPKSKLRAQARAARKTAAETEAKLKALTKQESVLKKKLTRLECAIVATPVVHQETRLRNWNTLPPPDDLPRRRQFGPKITRVQAQLIRAARVRQALFAFFLVAIFTGFACWFFYQIRLHHLWE